MNKLIFEYSKPESVGIQSDWIKNFLGRLEQCHLPMHSFILMKDDKIVAETYYVPYRADTQHRMFSITKSFVSIAIGLLAEEGKLSLDDKIVSFFPEKLPEDELSPYLSEMTIRHMLMMATCHRMTTYKAPGVTDWVGSFFTTPPSHVPGTTFSYDTSSTHTMCALVEKLSGMKLLDYLRVKFLDEIGFSKEAYVMEAPGGESYGGSGLMSTPVDLLKFMYVIAKGGKVGDKQLLPADYVREATACQIDTYGKSSSWEEMQGYGYQFWRTTHNGFCCYGMGGQYACFYPKQNLLFITTADTQGRMGGTQLIFDAFYQEIYDKIGMPVQESSFDLAEYLDSRTLFAVPGEHSSDILQEINHTKYILDKNETGFIWMELSLEESEGKLRYETSEGVFELGFGIGYNKIVTFPKYEYRAAVSGAFRDENTFLIKANIVDECIGNLFIQLVFKGDQLTVLMRKFEETMFNEFDGFISGRKE